MLAICRIGTKIFVPIGFAHGVGDYEFAVGIRGFGLRVYFLTNCHGFCITCSHARVPNCWIADLSLM